MRAPTSRNILKLAWPMAGNTMMLHGLVVIDAYLVSPLGESALAAMGLAGSIGGVLIGIIFAFTSATQILMAQATGVGNPVQTKSTFYCGLAVNLIMSVASFALVLTAAPPLIHTVAHTDWIAAEAQSYLAVFVLIVFSEAISQCLSAYFNGTGNTRLPFYSHVIALPVNVLLSAALIYGLWGFPELGVTGAAVGSLMGAIARTLFLSWHMQRATAWFVATPGWHHGAFPSALRVHFVFSLPVAATFVSVSLANNASMLLFANLPVNQFAAITLILPWLHLGGQMMMSWTQATGILVGQLLGAKADDRTLTTFLKRAWQNAMLLAALVTAIYLGICLSFSWIYSGLEDETRATLWSFLPVLLLLSFPKGSNAICGNTLRAGGDTVYVMNLFLAATWGFRVPMIAICVLILNLSATWVFAIYLIEEFVKFPAFHLRLLSGKWKHKLNQRSSA